jgi:GNAT superfamily N-acetyltransferase
MDEQRLREATIKDVPLISSLAGKIWWQHYPAIITSDQINYMLDLMYSPENLIGQMQKDIFYLIELNGIPQGFLSVRKEDEKSWFLPKFYVNQELAGKGIGARAFRQLLEALEAQTISLTVNRKNYTSINFYFKLGFHIEKVADFDIGAGYEMNDFVMRWNAPGHRR